MKMSRFKSALFSLITILAVGQATMAQDNIPARVCVKNYRSTFRPFWVNAWEQTFINHRQERIEILPIRDESGKQLRARVYRDTFRAFSAPTSQDLGICNIVSGAEETKFVCRLNVNEDFTVSIHPDNLRAKFRKGIISENIRCWNESDKVKLTHRKATDQL